MRNLGSDIRHAVRVLLKNPRFSLVAIAALALGIGANAAIFSVVNAVLLRPLPYPDPDRLVQACRQFPTGRGCAISIPKYVAWRGANAFQSVAAYDLAGPGMNLGGGDRPEQVRGIHVSAGYFNVFGATLAIGRMFTEDEDRPGGPNVVILSHGLWTSRFGNDPQVVGRSVPINGDPHTVLGVVSRGFRPTPEADLFIPLKADPVSTNQGNFLNVSARLRPDVSVEAARAEVKVLGDQFRRNNPKWMGSDESATILPMRDLVVEDVRTALLILLGAVGLVLLIACANVASLLLARAAGRQREVAIRAAIGAGRGAIIRQLLMESVLLAGIGALVGSIAGVAGARALIALSPSNLPRAAELAHTSLAAAILDWRVLSFTLILSIVTGVLFGLAPALHLARTDVGANLKEGGGRGTSGSRAARTRGALVVAEISLALVLLVGATLLIRTFAGLRQVEPGFNPQQLLTFQTSLAGSKYGASRDVERMTREVTQRINALPAVVASATAISLPTEPGPDLPFVIEGRPLKDGALYHGGDQYRNISADYFTAMSIPLSRGRLFADRDTTGSPPVVIINATMARKHWPNEDPLGQRINIGRGLGPEFEDVTREIVGIVGDVREHGLDRAAPGVMYVPNGQVPDGLMGLANSALPTAWLVRSAALPSSLSGLSGLSGLSAQIQKEVLTVDPLLAIANVRTMEQVLGSSIAQQNFNMVLLTIFGLTALALAAIGIYGLMSYSVEQSTHDIGVRLALGADQRDILSLVVFRGMRLAISGLILGVAAAAGAVRVLSGMLFGVRPLDPATFIVVVTTLALTALLACYLPARRAMRVDPIVALRNE
jgi:putative ABC transport system permease protein